MILPFYHLTDKHTPDRSASGSEWPQKEEIKDKANYILLGPSRKIFYVEPLQNTYSTGITVRPKSDFIQYSIL